MKKKKSIRILPVFILSVLIALSTCACSFFPGNSNQSGNTGGEQTQTEDPSIRSVYGLYVESCAKSGEEPLSYEDWLAAIKGEKGDKGDKGDKGEDGNGWLYGSGAPQNSIGKNGDLYLDYATWDVYTKDSGVWNKRGNIEGGKGDGGAEPVTAELEIIFPELGNGNAGDCTLLKTGNTEVLIDAGSKRNSAAVLVPFLTEYCTDGVLEYVIVTHAHEDHIAAFVGNNGTDGIFANFRCGTIIDFAKSDSDSKISKDYKAARDNEVSSDGATHYTALECWNETNGAKREYTLAEGISFEILYQKFYEVKSSDENNYSVCTLFTQGENHFLFTGDLEEEGEESLVEENDLPHCKLFKAGHHGSPTSSNEILLQAVTPEVVCVCCCAGSYEYTKTDANTFPSQAFIDRVARYTKEIYVTTLAIVDKEKKSTTGFLSMNGNITVLSDGTEITVTGSNNSTILKETEWFSDNRTWPADGVR